MTHTGQKDYSTQVSGLKVKISDFEISWAPIFQIEWLIWYIFSINIGPQFH